MFKIFFTTLLRIIFHTSSEWKNLSQQSNTNRETLQINHLFQVIGLIIICSFVKSWTEDGIVNIQLVLKLVLKQTFTYGGGFYFAVLIISKYLFPFFQIKKNKYVIKQFVAYSFSVVFVFAILESLFPFLFLFRFCMVYTVFIVWKGIIEFLKMDSKNSIKLAFIITFPIIFSPIFIHFLIEILIPGIITS